LNRLKNEPFLKDYRLWYLLILELLHMFLPLSWGDDRVFFEKARVMRFPDFLQGSSRILIDALTYGFAKLPFLWRLLNPLVLLGLTSFLIWLLSLQTNRQKLCAGILILFPSMALADAGFMATTLNYLWPFTAGMFAVYSLRAFQPDRVSVVRIIAALPLLLYAASMQQTAALLLIVLVLQLVLAVKDKSAQKSVAATLYLLITMVAAVFLFYRSFFGENPRFAREAARYFPDFAGLSLFQRAELGFSATLHGLTSANLSALAFLAFCVFLCVMTLRRNHMKRTLKFVSFLPPILTIALVVFQEFLENTTLWNLLRPPVNARMSHAAYSFSPLMDILYLGLMGLVLFIALRLASGNVNRLLAAFVLALGFLLRMMMGFSPTVWASGFRTFFFPIIAMIICAGFQIKTESAEIIKDRKYKSVFT